ncbi:MAG: glycerophosphodiester phosphodiesterase family protein, partial [Pirellulales bacterium]
MLTVFCFVPPSAAWAVDLVWNFDGAMPLTVSNGSATISYYDPLGSGWGPLNTQFGPPASFGLPAFPDGGAGSVMSFPATTPYQGYRVNHGSGAASAYTMIWDYLSPASADGQWRALLQSSTSNANDGDFFIQNQPGGGIGIQGVYHGSIAPNTWNRIAMTRDSAGVMNKYINGTWVGTQSATDGRFALDPFFYILTDEDNETEPGYLSSFRYVDSVMAAEQVRLLGNVAAAGAAVPGPAIPDPPPPPPEPTPPLFGRTQIMGHRGGGTLAPENTLAGIAKGFEVGADLIEVDLHLTSDGHAVVFHDSTLDRTTNGTGPIVNVTLAQLKSLDAGSWFGPQYAGEQVPTLTEALEFIAGRGRLLLDVKVTPNLALRDAIVASLSASGATLDDIWVWPSNSSYSSDVRFGAAEIQLLSSIPSNLSDANLLALKASGIDGLSVGDGSITQEVINAFHRNGLFVDVYTVNDQIRMQQLISMGVDSIETDRPDLMAGLIFSGDYNADGIADTADYVVWRNTLHQTGDDLAADGNGNKEIDVGDYDLWRAHFGQMVPDGGSGSTGASRSQPAVPEPAVSMYLMEMLALLIRRRMVVWTCTVG